MKFFNNIKFLKIGASCSNVDKTNPDKEPEASQKASMDEVVKLPNNPKYWQSANNVAFKGKAKSELSFDEEISELRGLFYKNPNKEQNALCLEKINNYRKQTGDDESAALYAKLIQSAFHLFDEQVKDNKIAIIDKFFEKGEKIKISPDYILKAFEPLDGYRNFKEMANVYKLVLSFSDFSIQEKIEWLSLAFNPKNIDINDATALKESLHDSIVYYFELKSRFDGDENGVAAYCAEKLNFDTQDFKNVLYLIDEGILEKQHFINMKIYDITEYNENVVPAYKSILNKIAKNSELASYFNLLRCSFHFVHMTETDKLLDGYTPFKKEVLEYLKNNAKTISNGENSYPEVPFYSVKEFGKFFEVVVPENFEDFKAAHKNEADTTKDSLEISEMSNLINPKTGLFDMDVYNLFKSFRDRTPKYLLKSVMPIKLSNSELASLASKCFDKKSGKINKGALAFVEQNYFDNIGTKTGKTPKVISPGAFAYNRDAKYMILDLIEYMKDKTGSFNSYNVKAVHRLANELYRFPKNIKYLNGLKNKDGVVDKSKLNRMINCSLLLEDNANKLNQVLELMDSFEPDTADNIMYTMTELFNEEGCAIKNYANTVPYLFSKIGEVNEELYDYLKEIIKKHKEIIFPKEFFEVIEDKENKQLFLQLSNTTKEEFFSDYKLKVFAKLFDKYGNKEGRLPKFVQDKLLYTCECGLSFKRFDDIFQECIRNKENPEDNFDSENFEKTVHFYKNLDYFYDISLDPKDAIQIVSGKLERTNLSFKKKLEIFNNLKLCQDKTPLINKIIEDIDANLKVDNISLEVDDLHKSEFLRSVIGSSFNDKYSEFEKTLTDSIPYLEKLKDGLPIKYTREQFLLDLNKAANTPEKREILEKKGGISLNINDNKIIGYEGIIALDKFDKTDDFEKGLYDLCNKFMYKNEVQTQDLKFNNELNKIIKALPEFINTIGKRQHETHAYSLDIHQLLVLAYSIQNKDYLELTGLEKTILKLACILHDLGKREDIVDPDHQLPSAYWARSIIRKVIPNEETKDRVYDIIKKHHWLKDYANSKEKEKCAKETAFDFRRYNDFQIAKIMARSDLKAVSNEFYQACRGALDNDNLRPIEKALEEFYSTGCVVFSDSIVKNNKSKIPVKNINGVDYKIINLHDIKDNEDMGEYGFRKGVLKKDLTFLVHMVDGKGIEESLRTVKLLSSSVGAGVLSESLITPKYQRTYSYRKYGAILSQINANTFTICDKNQGSGTRKEKNDAIDLVFEYDRADRQNFREGFLENLGLNKNEVSDKEFADFYKKNLINKVLLEQFSASKKYTLGGKTFTGEDIKNAIVKYQDSLIDKTQNMHNEVVGYAPKITALVAKKKNAKKLPQEFLDFAKNNDLPIVLI